MALLPVGWKALGLYHASAYEAAPSELRRGKSPIVPRQPELGQLEESIQGGIQFLPILTYAGLRGKEAFLFAQNPTVRHILPISPSSPPLSL